MKRDICMVDESNSIDNIVFWASWKLELGRSGSVLPDEALGRVRCLQNVGHYIYGRGKQR